MGTEFRMGTKQTLQPDTLESRVGVWECEGCMSAQRHGASPATRGVLQRGAQGEISNRHKDDARVPWNGRRGIPRGTQTP